MIVYGDGVRTVEPKQALASIEATLAGADDDPDQLVSALIQCGELAQGLADAEFEAAGCDDVTPLQAAAMSLTIAVARLCDGECDGDRTFVQDALDALRRAPLPDRIVCKTAEGFAFYAVHPAAYAAAARRVGWPSPPLVIGLRSIGATLAAVAAVASGARTAITLRPCGDPFRRRLQLSEALRERLHTHAGTFLVADEGPGLSGSSFAAVADALAELGVQASRIVFMPSHAGPPGCMASPAVKRVWDAVRRVDATFEQQQRDSPVADLFANIIGAATGVEDLSGGAWRGVAPGRALAPAWPMQERRKFRISSASGVYLAKFAGLGPTGEAKRAMADRLADANFAPRPLALRGGFLLQPWIDAEPLSLAGGTRPALLQRLGDYLAFRASAFLAADHEGASLDALREMALVNAGELGGAPMREAMARRLASFAPPPPLRPIRIDGRLHVWEWLQTGDGRVLKADALDHGCAHDLVGCQDVAWDIAGALVEFQLSRDEAAALVALVERRTRRLVRPDTLDLFTLFYCAFQAGYWDFAAGSAAEADAPTVLALRDSYARRLGQALSPPGEQTAGVSLRRAPSASAAPSPGGAG